MNERILLVEDEEALLMTLTDRLRSEGYSIEVARNGDDGYNHGTRDVFDLIILDVQLPKRNGFDVCRDIRQAGVATPVLMLTARAQTVDKVVGLKIGADDYVTKPFEMMELMARIEALLRRAPMRTQEPDEVQQFGDLKIDLRGTEVSRDGKNVPLSAREFQLLRYLVENRGKTVSRGELLKEVWGYNAATVASLRQKIEDDPKQPQLVVTVPGLGYKFASA
jgi:two-component system alkaline phosphatase synthesis response regulator PhoP